MIEVRELTDAEYSDHGFLHELGELFATAFQAEGVNKYIFDFSDEKTKQLHIKNFIAELVYNSNLRTLKILVALEDGNIVGGVLIKGSEEVTVPLKKNLEILRQKVKNYIPLITKIRWRNVWRFLKMLKPSEKISGKYDTVLAIAVKSSQQGRGIGKIILAKVTELVEQAKLDGIYLFTADIKNKLLYEKFKYELFETKTGRGLEVYHMYRKLDLGKAA